MLSAGNFSQRVVGRMLDFFAVHAPWQRRLWNVSATMAVDEIIEASEAVRDRALGQASLDWFRESLRGRISKDPGVGDTQQLAAIQMALQTKIVADGEAHRLLRHVAADVRQNYLSRWCDALDHQNHGQQPERVARALASHLLDAGISQDHLHRWLTYLRDHDATEHDVPSVVSEAKSLLGKKPKRFRVLALFETDFPPGVSRPAEFLDHDDAQQWLVDRGLHGLLTSAQYRGGLLLRLKSSDPEAAVELAADIVGRIVARAAVGARHELRLMASVLLPAILKGGTSCGVVVVSTCVRLNVRIS